MSMARCFAIATAGSPSSARPEYEKVAGRLEQYAPDVAGGLRAYLADPKDSAAVQQKFQAFLSSIPPGYYPPEKLARTIGTVRRTGVEGIVDLFGRGHPLLGPVGTRREVLLRGILISRNPWLQFGTESADLSLDGRY